MSKTRKKEFFQELISKAGLPKLTSECQANDTALFKAFKGSMGNLSIDQRNALVEQYLWCIDSVMWQNGSLIRAAHLDREDVYQSLAVRLIRAVELYDPDKKSGGSLKGYIFMSLCYEMRSCSNARTQYREIRPKI